MKRIIISILVIFAMIPVLPLLSISAAPIPLSVDKPEYSTGEAIMVTAGGSGKDWVGLYKKGEAPGDKTDSGDVIPSIYWYYVAADGNTPGTAVQIQNATYKNDRGDLSGIPEGEYTFFLCENDSYTVTASVDIKVKAGSDSAADSAPNAPVSITYDRKAVQTGYADGSVTVKLDEAGAAATDVVVYFADEKGPLKGYSSLAKQKSAKLTVSFDMVKNTLIPAGATRLLAYSANSKGLSDSYAECALPADASKYDFGDPLYELQIVSDLHMTEDDGHIHNKHFETMLNDITANSPRSAGIFAVGDLTDKGLVGEFVRIKKIYGSVANAPEMFWVIGNHDVSYSGTYESQLELFNKYSGNTSAYYDFWKNDTHFIFLASEEKSLTAKLSDYQLTWFQQKLAENYMAGRPIFIFLHQSIYNTVAGSLQGQNWDGVGKEGVDDEADVRLRAILAKYPEAMLFSGHSHWELNSVSTMHERNDNMCTAFNTASVGYLWSSYNDLHSTGDYYNADKGGSHGYYVRVYKDKVLVLGRDFEKGEWLPSAMFSVDYAGLKLPDGSSDDTNNNSGKSAEKDGHNESGTCNWLMLGLIGVLVLAAIVAAVVVISRKRQK